MNGDLARAWKRLKKKYGWDDTENVDAELREDLIRFVPVPRAMGEELAEFYLASPIDEDRVWKAEEILELLVGTWSAQSSTLTEDDWEYLKEQINIWAMDIDMDIVTGVMRAVVERGGFSED